MSKTTTFQQSVAATTGAYAGAYLWSNPANWTAGLPATNDDVIDTLASTDDIGSLSLMALTTSGQFVVAGTLIVALMDLEVGSSILIAGGSGTATLQVSGNFIGAPGTITAQGTGSSFIDTATSGSGDTLIASSGGTIDLVFPVISGTKLAFNGAGVIAFRSPSTTTSVPISGINVFSTLELPGNSASDVQFIRDGLSGSSKMVVTTSAGTFTFANLSFAGPTLQNVSVFSDPTTGLEAITFADTFKPTVGSPSLWSNSANWSDGSPVNGDAVVAVQNGSTAATDDIANLSLVSLYDALPALTIQGVLNVGTLTENGPILVLGTAAALTAGAIMAGGSITVSGTGATFATAVTVADPGLSLTATAGGTIALHASLAANSQVSFNGAGVLELFAPAYSTLAHVTGVTSAATLEVPGTVVTSVAFGTGPGPNTVTVLTDAGQFGFANVAFAGTGLAAVPVNFTATHSAASGLEAITIRTTDVFSDTVTATSGPNAGRFLWSTAANWSEGAPVAGDSVQVLGAGTDDVASLALTSLNDAGVGLTVAGVLTTGALAVSPTANVTLSAGAALTFGALSGAGAQFTLGTGSLLVDHAAADPGERFTLNGGTLELPGTVSAASTLSLNSGELALFNPGSSIAAPLQVSGLNPTLELPGTVLTGLTASATALNVTTDKGSFAFGNVSFANPLAAFAASADATTGLLAIVFSASDVFSHAVATGGQYLWSTAANWSRGVPAGGDATASATGVDDIGRLALDRLSETTGGGVAVTGTLSVATVFGTAGTTLEAVGSASPASGTGGALAGSGGTYGASGAQARFVSTANVDPGETYLAQSGASVTLAAAAPASTLNFSGAGTIALTNPGTLVAASVTGIVAGDRLELPGTALSASLGAGGLAATTATGTVSFDNLVFAGGATGVTVGQDAASGLATLTFTDQARAADFNGDGTSDQLWQTAAGVIVDYGMHNGAIVSAMAVGVLGAGYTFLAAGDFNGDGTADQLWQAASGAIVDYTMQNGGITGAAIVGSLDPTYKFLAAADFNGDGTADQLWRAANGTVIDYAMSNGTISAASVVGSFGANMRFLAAADFNGDGRADTLWQNTTTGAIIDDTMNGATIVSSVMVGALDATWKFLAAGDFNGDGTADQLWQNASGMIVDYGMTNGTISGAAVVGALDASNKFLA